jgi:signal transduction histidine kinase
VALSYYLAAHVGLALTPQGSAISMLWPPNALLMAALLLSPLRHWWLLVAAALPAHLAAELQSGVPLSMVLGWYVSNCSEALLGAAAVRLACGRAPRFDAFRDLGIFLLLGALLAPLLSSFLDAALVTLLQWDGGYWRLVSTRAPSNMLAALLVVPLVLTWAQADGAALRAPARRHVEAGLLFGGLTLVSLLVFNGLDPGARRAPALFYVPLPFLLWAAVRFGAIGVSTANLVLAAAAVWGAVHGLGPFVDGARQDNARDVHLFLIAVTVPLLLLAVLLDERRRIELETRAQRQQLAHLSRVALMGGLSGALAHELNQPLTAILSNAQAAEHMLAAGRMDPVALGEILRDIVAADRRASEVIHRLRALFKNGDAQLQDLDVNEMLREVLDLAHGDLATRHVTIVQRVEARLPRARGDRIQLQQVLLNLVVNACEAMSAAGGGERVLRMETRRGPRGEVQISVIDSGPGFQANAETLFEPFYTTKPQGLGLGLAISRSIVSAHGGRLWGDSAPGWGAAFHLHLPAARAADAHPTLVQ